MSQPLKLSFFFQEKMAVAAAGVFIGMLSEASKLKQFGIMNGSGSLVSKRRYMMITLVNKSEFDIHPVDTWFYSGRFWTAPAVCNKMSKMGFSGCNRDWSIATGVSGVVLFTIRVAGKEHPLSVAFCNPMAGGIMCHAEFNADYRGVWQRMIRHVIYREDLAIGDFEDKEGKPLSIKLALIAIPGMDAMVDITEQRNY